MLKSGRFLVFVASLTLVAMAASADIPQLITYQGRLTDSGGAPVAKPEGCNRQTSAAFYARWTPTATRWSPRPKIPC